MGISTRKIKGLLILLVLGVLVITITVVTRLPKVQPTPEAQTTPVDTSGLPDTPPKPYVYNTLTRDSYLNSLTWRAREYTDSYSVFMYYSGKFLGWRAEGNNIIVSIDTDKNTGGEMDLVYSGGSLFGVAAIRGDEVQFFTPVNSPEIVKKALDKYIQIGDPVKIYVAVDKPFRDGSVFKITTFR
jgi:hypothetical protein